MSKWKEKVMFVAKVKSNLNFELASSRKKDIRPAFAALEYPSYYSLVNKKILTGLLIISLGTNLNDFYQN